jgi:hypothetical protein
MQDTQYIQGVDVPSPSHSRAADAAHSRNGVGFESVKPAEGQTANALASSYTVRSK